MLIYCAEGRQGKSGKRAEGGEKKEAGSQKKKSENRQRKRKRTGKKENRTPERERRGEKKRKARGRERRQAATDLRERLRDPSPVHMYIGDPAVGCQAARPVRRFGNLVVITHPSSCWLDGLELVHRHLD